MYRQTDKTNVLLAGITRRSYSCTNPKKVHLLCLFLLEIIPEVSLFCPQVHQCAVFLLHFCHVSFSLHCLGLSCACHSFETLPPQLL